MSNSLFSLSTIKSLNLFCLFVAVFLMLFLPVRKEIWYDETVSVRCSKGISHDTPFEVGGSGKINSDEIHALNTVGNVYHATLVDNGNSFLYNLLLHWFTMLFGNSIVRYELFSRLCGVAALLAFFKLSRLFLGNTIFTALAIVLFATDKDLWGMGHEIRAYVLGIFFVAMAVAHCVRFINGQEKPIDLLLTGLFSVGAILSHYLSIYIILVIICYLFYTKKTKLFSLKNLLALALPIGIMVVYFIFSFNAFVNMNAQNHRITEKAAAHGFSIAEVILRSLHFTAINFKAVFPAYKGSRVIAMMSALLVSVLLAAGYKLGTVEQRKNVMLLFILGISSSLFLAILSIKAHHYTALYYRYYSFCVPFASLFVAYVLMIVVSNNKLNMAMKGSVVALFLIPCALLFVKGARPTKLELRYNHLAIVKAIEKENLTKVGVPACDDALFIQCFLPDEHKVEYVMSPGTSDFVLYRPAGEQKIAVIKNDN